MASLPDTHCICFYGLENSLRFHSFKATWPSLINSSKVSLAIWIFYCDQLYHHLLYNKCFWLILWHYGPCKSSQIKIHYTMHQCGFQITHGVKQSIYYHNTTNYSLNCFCHVIYTPQISTYQNTAKLLFLQVIIHICSLKLKDTSLKIIINVFWKTLATPFLVLFGHYRPLPK